MSKILNLLKLRYFANPGDAAVEVATINDTEPRLRIDAGGKLNWGAGSSAIDTNLYRNTASELKTDYDLTVGGDLTVVNDNFYVNGKGITTTGATTGQVLTYDGTKFAPAASSAGVGYDGITSDSFANAMDSTSIFNLNKIGALSVGTRIRAFGTTNSVVIEGNITSIGSSPLSITVAVDYTYFPSAVFDFGWNISVAGVQGPTGPAGPTANIRDLEIKFLMEVI